MTCFVYLTTLREQANQKQPDTYNREQPSRSCIENRFCYISYHSGYRVSFILVSQRVPMAPIWVISLQIDSSRPFIKMLDTVCEDKTNKAF